MGFVLVDLLVFQGSLLQHAVRELQDGCGAKPAECGDGSIARNPIGDGPARHRNSVLRRYAASSLFLRMTEVVQAQRSCDEARGIFHTFQAREGRKVFAAISAEIDLELAKAVLAQAAFDDAPPVASWTEIRLRLNGHAQGRGSLAQAEHARVYSRGREGGSDEFRRGRLAVQATDSAKGQGCSEERVKAITNS